MRAFVTRWAGPIDVHGVGLTRDIKPLGTDQFDSQVARGDDSHDASQPQDRHFAQKILIPCKTKCL